jgi:ubiquinone/menaquinone biosynthesis C-methylase UbiE
MVAGNDKTSGDRIYDWWSRHPQVLKGLYGVAFLGREGTFRRRAIDTLTLTAGECVLDVGCGNGNSFASLRDAVDSSGTIVGLDVSRGMARSARDRMLDASWQNVHVIRGDTRRPPFGTATFDAAYASMSLSAVPHPQRAIDAVKTALRPGGRFVVLDAQPFQRWPWRLVNPFVIPVAKRTTNWVPEIDIVAALRHTFETVDIETYNAGSIFVARAQKHERNQPND